MNTRERDFQEEIRTELPQSPLERIEPTRPPERPEGKRKKARRGRSGSAFGWLNGLLTFLFVAMLSVVGGFVWFNLQLERPGPVTETKLVRIKQGLGTRSIAEVLEEQKVIASRHVFLAYYYGRSLWQRLNGERYDPLKAGDYQFQPGDNVRAVLGRIAQGKSVLHAVTIPEGFTTYQIAQRLLRDERLVGELPELPPEGFLKPETYLVPPRTARARVLTMMQDAQREFLRKAWAARQENLPFKDVSEALILASIVQRETGPNDDPARIASVFINRLRKGMRLQSDPTILYGKFGTQVDWGATIYRSDIARKTSHNTYQISGLPPTPICNPGRVSINAVLNPARTDDLYFVADGRGGHIFSRTNKEHIKAVARWRQIEKEIKAKDPETAAKPEDVKPRTVRTSVVTVTPTTRNPGTGAAPKEPETVAAAGSTSPMSSFGFPLPVRKPRQ